MASGREDIDKEVVELAMEPLLSKPPKLPKININVTHHPILTSELSEIEEESSGNPTPVPQKKGPTLHIPPVDNINFDLIVDTVTGSTTAPASHDLSRGRFFSFGNATNGVRPPGASPRRPRYLRQNTVSGGDSEAQERDFPHILSRAISRTYTLASTASSSIPVEEWRPIFDKLDRESDGKVDGLIPVEKFREILEDDPLWMETVPPEVQEKILGSVDKNNDGVIDYEEFIELVKGKNIGFGRRKRRAFRELLKQTVEFIVPYKYSYQNQYSCSPPPVFMIGISLLQLVIFAYNSAVMYKAIGYIGLNGPVPYCSRLIYNPDKRHELWRYVTYMFIHSGIFHATFNILVQLVLGIPLEMVHGIIGKSKASRELVIGF